MGVWIVLQTLAPAKGRTIVDLTLQRGSRKAWARRKQYSMTVLVKKWEPCDIVVTQHNRLCAACASI